MELSPIQPNSAALWQLTLPKLRATTCEVWGASLAIYTYNAVIDSYVLQSQAKTTPPKCWNSASKALKPCASRRDVLLRLTGFIPLLRFSHSRRLHTTHVIPIHFQRWKRSILGYNTGSLYPSLQAQRQGQDNTSASKTVLQSCGNRAGLDNSADCEDSSVCLHILRKCLPWRLSVKETHQVIVLCSCTSRNELYMHITRTDKNQVLGTRWNKYWISW